MMDGLGKLLPVTDMYRDLLQPAAKEVGGALGSAAKVARFFAAPIEYLAAYHERWQRYLKRITELVPEERRCEPVAQVVGPAVEGLRYVEENGLLAEMFVRLLARAMDRDRVSEAHPAFAAVLGQLSPDEAMILWHLSKKPYALQQSAPYRSETRTFGPRTVDENEFPQGDLAYPQNFFLYLDHLHSLNLAGVWQQGNQEVIWEGDGPTRKQSGVIIRSATQLTEFGQMLAKACIPDDLHDEWRAPKAN